MSDKFQQCPYCPQWVEGDLWMTVHLEQAHSDLMPLFSGIDRRPSKQSKQEANREQRQ